MGLVPTILMLICSSFFINRCYTMLQHRIQGTYFWCLVVFVLLVTCIGGSLANTAKAIAKKPSMVFLLLADNLPTASHFYLNYFPIQAGGIALEMTRYVVYLKNRAMLAFFDEERARELSEPEDQDSYGMGARSARMTLLLTIVLVFASICPLMCLMGYLLFLMSRFQYKYLFVYAETYKDCLGGDHFVSQIEHIQFGLYLYLFVMVGILMRKASSNTEVAICAGSFGIHFWAMRKLARDFGQTWLSLPFRELASEDEEDKLNAPQTPEEFRKRKNTFTEPDIIPPEPLGKDAAHGSVSSRILSEFGMSLPVPGAQPI